MTVPRFYNMEKDLSLEMASSAASEFNPLKPFALPIIPNRAWLAFELLNRK